MKKAIIQIRTKQNKLSTHTHTHTENLIDNRTAKERNSEFQGKKRIKKAKDNLHCLQIVCIYSINDKNPLDKELYEQGPNDLQVIGAHTRRVQFDCWMLFNSDRWSINGVCGQVIQQQKNGSKIVLIWSFNRCCPLVNPGYEFGLESEFQNPQIHTN